MGEQDSQPPADKPEDIYESASKAIDQADEEEWPEYAKRKWPKPSRKLVKYSSIVFVVVVLAVGAYALLKGHKSHSANSSASQASAANSGVSGNVQLYTASGNDINLSFSYPSNWSVTPTSGTDSNNQTITVNSPSTTIESADNTSVTGKLTVTIRAGGSTINELNANNPTVTQDSTQFGYTAPTSSQHQFPYLTFVHFSNGSKAPGAFEEAIVTGVQTFTKGTTILPGDLSQLDPIISASFYKCSDSTCAGQGSGILSITSSTWQNDKLFNQAQTLFASLKLH